MNDRLAVLLCAILASMACGKTTREPPMVCVDSGNEIALDKACTDVVTVACPEESAWWTLEDALSWKIASCFSCGVKAKIHINIHDHCATTVDLLAVDLIPEIATPGSWEAGVDLTQQREEGLRCLVDTLHRMTLSCDREIPCLDVEVAGQCESP
jgi:hypothetical protein